MSTAAEVLDFWFGKPGIPSYGKQRSFWFNKKPKFDQELKTRFLADHEQAAANQLNHWQDSPRNCLALILLLDQFPRHMFRGTPQAFATDLQALSVAQFAVRHSFDQKLLAVERWFVYLPFQHSEDLALQRQGVELVTALSDDPGSAATIDYAVRHYAVIERFGRFPHRNKILGRVSTPEEAEFLKQPGSSF